MERYVIAVKRACRSEAPEDWLDRLKAVEGLELCGEPQSQRAQIQVTQAALAEITRSFGGYCHIEAVIPHSLSSE